MAANTAFADFPRLGALHAGDGFLPKQLTAKGSRLVFSRGIMTLAGFSSLLVILFKASVSGLIPLYAIGVFLSFTLSQTGMARRWWKSGHLKPGEQLVEPGSTIVHEKGWLLRMCINGFGAVLTGYCHDHFCSHQVQRWRMGGGRIDPPSGRRILCHSSPLQRPGRAAIDLENHVYQKRMVRNRVIMPIGGVHNGTLMALRYASTLSMDFTALHISIDQKETEKIEQKWANWGEGVRLVVLHSPYREFMEPLLEYIDQLSEQLGPNEVITIVVPQFNPRRWWTRFLHTRTAEMIRRSLLNRSNIVILEVPYQVE